MQIVSDYEELFKVRTFAEEKKKNPMMSRAFECTYERLKNDLKNQYTDNIDEKINRWIGISKVQYFKDLIPVTFYIQAKMLYRDGFYEAAISVSRSICEMICHEELSKLPHPFGDLSFADKQSPTFNALKQFLLLPKKIEKKTFKEEIVAKIVDNNPKDTDSNFLKSSYELNKSDGYYHLKIGNAKKEENLIRFLKIFKATNYKKFETFEPDVLKELEHVWTNGSTYVHVKKSSQDAKTDAFQIVDRIGYVLFKLYAEDAKEGVTITSAYSRFPDICTGVTYGLEAYSTPEGAFIGYYNLPTENQMKRMFTVCGEWVGEWGINNKTTNAHLQFRKEGEYINCYMQLDVGKKEIPMGISFFGDYFFINQLKGDKSKYFFELSFLNEDTLIGRHKKYFQHAFFRRTK